MANFIPAFSACSLSENAIVKELGSGYKKYFRLRPI